MKKYVYDTNALLSYIHLLELKGDKIVPLIVLHELDRQKMGNGDLAFRARQAVRKLKELKDITYDFEHDTKHSLLNVGNNNNYDDVIIECAKKHNATLVTGDFLVELKAKAIGLDVYETDGKYEDDDYCGYKEVLLNDEERAHLYENPNKNLYDLLENEYLVIKNEYGNDIDCRKWNGEFLDEITDKNLNTIQLGKFKTLDLYQKAAVDSLSTNDITLLRGKAGSGKSLVALTYALHQLEKGKIARIVCMVNPVPVLDAQEIGFYKGDKDQKLLQSGIGNILISKIGDKNVVEAMIATGKLVLIPFVDIRGYDTQDNSLVWITEAQNLSKALMKLALQRIGKGSKIIIDGDDKAQVDSNAFSGINNGIKRMSKIFRGESVYGEIEFKKIYRSSIASIADKI